MAAICVICAFEGERSDLSFFLGGGGLIFIATIALGLMYLKTNDLIIANRLTVPDTEFLLTFCRPDFLMLRVLSQSLILWDSIEPSVKWVESKCPAVIANYRLGSKPSISVVMAADPDTELLRQCYANVVTGAIFSIGLKHVT